MSDTFITVVTPTEHGGFRVHLRPAKVLLEEVNFTLLDVDVEQKDYGLVTPSEAVWENTDHGYDLNAEVQITCQEFDQTWSLTLGTFWDLSFDHDTILGAKCVPEMKKKKDISRGEEFFLVAANFEQLKDNWSKFIILEGISYPNNYLSRDKNRKLARLL